MPYDDLRKGRVSLPNQIYSVTVTAHNRVPYFSDFQVGRLVVSEMRLLHDEEFLQSIAWVLMPDHLHWLFQLGEKEDLPTVLKAFKAVSTKRINRVLKRRGLIWQRAYYDHAILKDEDIRAIARYIVANPLRAGLVPKIGQYPLWDAMWLQHRG